MRPIACWSSWLVRPIASRSTAGGVAGRESGAQLAVLAPGAGAAAAEAHAARLRERCPDRLELEIAVSSWTDGMTAEGMLGAAAARLSPP